MQPHADWIARGVTMPAPHAVVIHDDVPPDAIAPGVILHPGVTLSGPHTLLGPGTQLGIGGGGRFHNVAAGARVSLYGGVFEDCVLLDDVTVRGTAELRGGTLLEEGCEAAHHVGYKMTLMMPWVVAGSLVNFCDALFAGGTSRKDHGEIGSCLALYNYTPWGDKFASRFGDVPNGVFLQSRRIFVGGQTQIVSPVRVGYGSVVAAGSALRRDVGPGRLIAEPPVPLDQAFDDTLLGALTPKLSATLDYLGQLRAWEAWYQQVRHPMAINEMQARLYERALVMLQQNREERWKRLVQFVERVPASLAAHEKRARGGDATSRRRAEEHRSILANWEATRSRGAALLDPLHTPTLDALSQIVAAHPATGAGSPSAATYLDRIRSLPPSLVAAGTTALQQLVDPVATLLDRTK